jgi:hypothetical protein
MCAFGALTTCYSVTASRSLAGEGGTRSVPPSRSPLTAGL